MKKNLYPVAWMVSVLIVSLTLTSAGIYGLTRPSLRVIATWKQPADLHYDDATYYLSVVESDLDWRGFPIYVARRYFIYVGRESGTPTYGHTLDFTFYPVADDIQTYIYNSLVEWSSQGVTFQTVSGHRLFIPRNMFVGGR